MWEDQNEFKYMESLNSTEPLFPVGASLAPLSESVPFALPEVVTL